MTAQTYRVTGMTCEHCAGTRSPGSCTGSNGVREVTVDFVPGGTSAVTVTSEAPLPPGAVAAALDEAGDYRLAGG